MTIKHSTSIRVRYADTDKMGIVYNGNYLTYFEVGRTELMRAHNLPYTTFESQGYLLPLIESYVNYKLPAYYDDIIEVEASIDIEKSGAILRFDYLIKCNGKILANGFTTHTFVNKNTMKPVRPPRQLTELSLSLKNK